MKCGRRSVVAVLAVVVCLAGCGGHRSGAARPARTTVASVAAAAVARPAAGPRPRLRARHACPGLRGFECAWLSVPLDYAGQARGHLHLRVALSKGGRPARGVLLFLAGGPGQPGVPFIARVHQVLGAALRGYRLVMFDQRGTGAGALQCPALQRAAGASDLVVPPPGVVAACARRIGVRRRYFTTPETLGDIDELRRALGAARLSLDGVSYGTFVAERYALAYPSRVARLVLDSVVPQQGADPLYLAALGSVARVLRSVCAAERCGWDPARDVAFVVRTRHDGPRLLNALVGDSVGAPTFPGVLAALRAARHGDAKALDAFLGEALRAERVPASFLSQGLHESTICLDLAAPWDPTASRARRAAAVSRVAARLAASALYPFDRATALGNGLLQGCLDWPRTRPPALAAGNPAQPLPHVPVLLLSGRRDLSTPLAWARQEAREAPLGRLLAVPRAGHSVQLRARDPVVGRTLRRFLAGG